MTITETVAVPTSPGPAALAVTTFADRGYRYIPSAFQYSSGVCALPGYRLNRIRFTRILPMAEGFAWIEQHLAERGLPTTAFVGCELRSPVPFSPDGFVAFNRVYANKLRSWNIFTEDDNPVARSNVCPVVDPPKESGFYAFTYITPDVASHNNTRPNFVIAGGAETLIGPTVPEERIIAFRNISPEGMKLKVSRTLEKMTDRLTAFGVGWSQTTTVHAYSVCDIGPLFVSEIARGGVAAHGLTWHACRPPVQDIDYEMDCRSIDLETVHVP